MDTLIGQVESRIGMKAKLLSGVVIIFVMLTSTATADKNHHERSNPGEFTSDMMKADGTPVMDMGVMKAHINKIQQIMDQIENTKGVKKKRVLPSVGTAYGYDAGYDWTDDGTYASATASGDVKEVTILQSAK